MKKTNLRNLTIMKLITKCLLMALLISTISCEQEKMNQPPQAKITRPSEGSEFKIGESITISAEAEDSDGEVAEVRFYINDIGISSSLSFPYTYEWNTADENEGTQTIKITAKDDDRATTFDEITIILNPGDPPVAAFTATPTTITAGQSVQFVDQSTNDPTSWSWDFGDGNTSSQQNPSHNYSSAVNYTVSLQVTNSHGSDTETKTDYITVMLNIGETGNFTDARDGKTYNWVKIGTQTWMAENLAYLPSVVGPDTGSYFDPYYYVNGYNGTSVTDAKSTTNYQTYGVLYNWKAAVNVCPEGWHLPTNTEWTELTNYLGGTSVAGGKLKETGTTHWASPNTGATNETGFSALPGGWRHHSGVFGFNGIDGLWWSATEANINNIIDAYRWGVPFDGSYIGHISESKKTGLSVRCVRD